MPGWTRRQRERVDAGKSLYVSLQEAVCAGLGLSSLNNSSELGGHSLSDNLPWGELHRGGIGGMGS